MPGPLRISSHCLQRRANCHLSRPLQCLHPSGLAGSKASEVLHQCGGPLVWWSVRIPLCVLSRPSIEPRHDFSLRPPPPRGYKVSFDTLNLVFEALTPLFEPCTYTARYRCNHGNIAAEAYLCLCGIREENRSDDVDSQAQGKHPQKKIKQQTIFTDECSTTSVTRPWRVSSSNAGLPGKWHRAIGRGHMPLSQGPDDQRCRPVDRTKRWSATLYTTAQALHRVPEKAEMRCRLAPERPFQGPKMSTR